MAGVFQAATGDGPPSALPERERTAEVRVAFEGLLQIRRVTNTTVPDPAGAPAAWELNQMVRAVALALEASGFQASALDASGARTATGYRVRPFDRARTVCVDWLGPPGSGAPQEEESRLTECAAALGRLGWEALLYRGPRRRRFLEVEPARSSASGA
ncbi:hypothetical protein SLUN_21605 [Streptomyces lunaelactis]|uniref:Uncharacterized protein n=1 Tax=Streptomyces lunaelactis TaxID=1535768 RepID=A0A2R4T5H2_9ACTN|nr:hypothetical protein [Streptomyces lunaelactis]AVZ74372.1 hypothetical protein SLUN_21605 [Streptomyces lunaelactis]NUK04712.1 hypothetical protein [Streptomyces lunaelactis]NUK11782.1 hypothetical protein [Streptomyces lunaelactis]NUK19492.1 hypothetical protein [Streptomyces lunaelactis]NUK27228.1 hypothetical protein [Streptomyces lunaelactis]